jgi:hypothetical protein
MTAHNRPEISRESAEQILAGTESGPPSLARIMAAATGPASSGELAGETAAMIRFHAARLEPAAVTRPTGLKLASNRLLAVKIGVVAALAAAGATGGVALAAARTQTNPAPRPAVPNTAPTLAAPSQEKPPSPAATAAPPPTHTAPSSVKPPAPRSSAASPARAPAPAPAQRLWGLCIAYRLATVGSGDRAIESKVFAPLVAAAGGKQQIAAYCSAVLRGEPWYPSDPKNHSGGGLLGPPVH